MNADAVTVRVMTWNIHGALGRNPRFDLAKVIALIRRHDPDVIALQEIDSRRPREAGIASPFLTLQTAFGAHWVDAKTIVAPDGEYGQALISRWPMPRVQVHDISCQEREPRRAICAEIESPAGAFRVVATHLGLSVGERRDQSRELLRIVGAGAPAVLLGDFNDWFWPGSVRGILAQAMPGRSRHRTFPSICPVFRFDRIYCRPASALLRSHTDRAARAVSDHLPVIGDIRLDRAAALEAQARAGLLENAPA